MLVIVPSDDTDLALEALAQHEEAWTVWYFSSGFLKYRHLVTTSAQNVNIGDVSSTINRIVPDLVGPLIDLGSDIPPKSTFDWDASNLSERSPYNSDILIRAAQYVAFRQLSETQANHAFIVGDPDFAELLYDEGQKAGIAVYWRKPKHKKPFVGQVFRFFLQLVKILSTLHIRLAGMRATLHRSIVLKKLRKRFPIPVRQLQEADVLIVNWVHSQTFNSEKPIQDDRTLGTFPDILGNEGQKIGYLGLPLDWVEPFKGIAENAVTAKDPALLIEDCMSKVSLLSSALWSLGAPFRLQPKLHACGFDLSALVRMEIFREWAAWRPVWARLLRNVAPFLEQKKIAPKFICYIYENQPWERMLINGLRAQFPEATLVGLQLSLFAPNYISFFPSRLTRENGLFPDYLMVPSPSFSSWYQKHGIPKKAVIEGGAIRYQTLLKKASSKPTRFKSAADEASILCCTSIEFDESLELVYAAAEALQNTSQLIVNFHPVTSIEFRQRFKSAIKELADFSLDHIAYTDEPTNKLLRKTTAVIYNSSGASFDALALGIPVIYVRRRFAIDYNKVPEDLCFECSSPEEIRRAVERIKYAELNDQRRNDRKKRLQDFLAPPNSTAISQIFR